MDQDATWYGGRPRPRRYCVKRDRARLFWEDPNFGGANRFPSLTRNILKLAYYRNYCIDSNQMLYSDKDHRMPFVNCPYTNITNPNWRTDAIFEKSKNRHISGTVWPIATKFGRVIHIDSLDPSALQHFGILKIQDGGRRHFEKFKNTGSSF